MSDHPPAWMVGAWRRDGRALDQGPMVETSRVLWLQVGEYFADFRKPTAESGAELCRLDQTQAFSGVARYREPTMVWHHDLDTMGRPTGHCDAADILRDGTRLIEQGPNYLERWQFAAPAEPGAVVESRDADTGQVVARMVLVADLGVLVVGGSRPAGALLRIDHDRWQIEDQIGVTTIPWAGISVARTDGAACGWQRVA